MWTAFEHQVRALRARSHLHLVLDPGADDVSLVGKLPAQTFIVLLSCVFLDQSLVALRHQLLDLSDTIRHDSQMLV